MTVWVDRERNHLGRMIMGHMISDNLLELHEMAAAIGLRREWFQVSSFPHYDVSISRRQLALIRGAVEVDVRELVAIIRGIRSEPWFDGWAWGAALRDVPQEDCLMTNQERVAEWHRDKPDWTQRFSARDWDTAERVAEQLDAATEENGVSCQLADPGRYCIHEAGHDGPCLTYPNP